VCDEGGGKCYLSPSLYHYPSQTLWANVSPRPSASSLPTNFCQQQQQPGQEGLEHDTLKWLDLSPSLVCMALEPRTVRLRNQRLRLGGGEGGMGV